MKQVEELLKYQQEDALLLRMENEEANSDARKAFVSSKNFLTKASEKLDALDAKASEIMHRIVELEKRFKALAETLADFENLDELIDSGADTAFYKKKISTITEKLRVIKSELTTLTGAAKDTDGEYRALKKKVKEVQEQYNSSLEVYKKYKDDRIIEKKPLQEKLEKLAATIDKKLLELYQAKRKERIFPILCEVNAGRCSKCGSELSLAGKEKVESGNPVECDNCHRLLYKKR